MLSDKFVNGDGSAMDLPKKVVHTLGNSLGYGAFDSSINEGITLAKTGINLSTLLKRRLLDEDGIEDVHFYFVSFNQHKNQILKS